jgi:acyl carrier protein
MKIWDDLGRFYRCACRTVLPLAEKAEWIMYVPSANPPDSMISADRSTDTSYDRIRAIVASRLGIGPGHLEDDSRIEQLGLDSVALAEVLVAVAEFYAVEIAADEIAARVTPVMTLRDLIDAFCTSIERAQSDWR